MRDENKEAIIRQLGNTQTVKDAQKAYQLIFDAERHFAVKLKQTQQNKQKQRAEIVTFLDDMDHILGISRESKLYWSIVGLTLDLRMRRHQIATEEAEYRKFLGPLAEFDDLNTPMGDLPSDGDLADEICRNDPEMRKYRKDLI